jgi:hypothetical protein
LLLAVVAAGKIVGKARQHMIRVHDSDGDLLVTAKSSPPTIEGKGMVAR